MKSFLVLSLFLVLIIFALLKFNNIVFAKQKLISHIKYNQASTNDINHRQKRNKILIIGIVTILIVIAGIIIGKSFYQNSDKYKTQKAIELLTSDFSGLSGGTHLDKAIELLNDVYTPKADVLRNYIEVEKSGIKFYKTSDRGNIPDKDAAEAYNEFHKIVEEFDDNNELYFLPEQLMNNYERYKTAFNYITEYIHNENSSKQSLYSSLYDIQMAIKKHIDLINTYENDSSVTLRELQEGVNVSQDALDYLEHFNFPEIEVNDKSVSKYCCVSTSDQDAKNTVYISSYTDDIYKYFLSACKEEISELQSVIDKASNRFDIDTPIYKSKGTHRMSINYVGIFLESVNDYSDIDNNRNTICNLISADMLHYLITGNIVFSRF